MTSSTNDTLLWCFKYNP